MYTKYPKLARFFKLCFAPQGQIFFCFSKNDADYKTAPVVAVFLTN